MTLRKYDGVQDVIVASILAFLMFFLSYQVIWAVFHPLTDAQVQVIRPSISNGSGVGSYREGVHILTTIITVRSGIVAKSVMICIGAGIAILGLALFINILQGFLKKKASP